jgi:hypothetical protein
MSFRALLDIRSDENFVMSEVSRLAYIRYEQMRKDCIYYMPEKHEKTNKRVQDLDTPSLFRKTYNYPFI